MDSECRLLRSCSRAEKAFPRGGDCFRWMLKCFKGYVRRVRLTFTLMLVSPLGGTIRSVGLAFAFAIIWLYIMQRCDNLQDLHGILVQALLLVEAGSFEVFPLFNAFCL